VLNTFVLQNHLFIFAEFHVIEFSEL